MNLFLARSGIALVAGALLLSPAARAQMSAPGTSNGVLTGPVVGTQSAPSGREAQPPALPGARTAAAEPAPSDRPAGDMRPNEALFDAVNRGDSTAARDALGRGADLNARDVLGLTPVELSVDLGRNDITFLLLSMRGAAAGPPPPAGETTGRPAVPARSAARPAPAHAVPRPAVAAAARPAAPAQYADIPGTPVPQAGFLGFGGGVR